MRLAKSLALSSLRQRPARTFMALLGIAVGIATVVGIFTLDHNTVVGLSSSDEEWRADIEVSPSTKILDPRSDLKDIPGIAAVSAFFQTDVQLAPSMETAESERRRVRFFAIEAESSARFAAYRVAEGRDLEAGGTLPELLIGEKLARELKLGPGAQIVLARPRRAAKKLCVEGKIETVETAEPLAPRLRSFRIAGILGREKLGRRAGGELVIADYAVGRELFEDVRVGETYLVERDPSVDVEKMKSSLGESYSYDLNRRVIVGEAADERAFRNGVRIAGLLAMVLGLYVIFHTLSIALVERVREIATLDALGASVRSIAGVFLLEAGILAFGGAAIGLLGGLGLAKLLLALRITTLGVGHDIEIFEIPWTTVLPLAATGALVALLGSVYPVTRIRSMRTAAILRGDDHLIPRTSGRGFRVAAALLLGLALPIAYLLLAPAIGEINLALGLTLIIAVGVLALLVGLPLLAPELLAQIGSRLAGLVKRPLPFASLLARRSIEEGPARLAVGVVGLAIVAAAFVALHGMTRSLAGEVEEWSQAALDDRVFITRCGAQDWEQISADLIALPAVAGVEHGSMRTYAPFLIQGVDTARLGRLGPLADPELARRFREERGILLSTRIAQDLNYRVGDSVLIRTGRGVVEPFPVLAVSDRLGYIPHPDERLYGLIDSELMRREFCVSPKKARRIGVQLAEGIDPRAGRSAIIEGLKATGTEPENWRIETGVGVRDYILEDIERDFALFDIILGLTALLAALGITNGQLLAALERTKELGVLRALGASSAQVRGMVFLEAAVTGFIGGGAGALLGYLMTPLVVEALELISGLQLPHVGAGWMPLWVILGAVLLSLLAAVFPAIRMAKMDTTRAIREG
jgi:putative ABC transport system permease protein